MKLTNKSLAHLWELSAKAGLCYMTSRNTNVNPHAAGGTSHLEHVLGLRPGGVDGQEDVRWKWPGEGGQRGERRERWGKSWER